MIAIRAAAFPDERAIVRRLFLEYAEWLNEDLCFQGFNEELASLPGKYDRPGGRVLLAFNEVRHAVGCCAYRPFHGSVCEIKRLWVRPEGRRLGSGKSLVLAAEEAARADGYTEAVLDTLDRMVPAMRLYESLGYQRTDAYYDNPIPGAVYFRKEL